MRKSYILLVAAAATAAGAQAQSSRINDYQTTDEEGLIESVAKIEKKTDKFNLYLNMHGDFAADWRNSDFQEGKFEMKQLRIEMKGDINDWLSYRYRQRLNKGDDPRGYRDNLLKSIDIAGIGVKLDKWQFFLGKQCAAYGGIEFDLNPIEIYQYSDMVDYMSNFMTGVNVAYNFTPQQQLQVQMLNALNGSSEEMYGAYEKAKLPMVYTVNWNGNFGDFYKTRWSASFMNETVGEHMWYFALGNEFNFSPKFGMYFDWLYSIEGVDRKGIITGIVGGDNPARNTSKVDYMSFLLHLNYRFLPKWNLFLKGMYETAGVYKSHDGIEKGNYRTSWGYIGGIEYYPLKDRNLHFFLAYVGRDYVYTGRARAYGEKGYTTNQLSAGFIWQMPVF